MREIALGRRHGGGADDVVAERKIAPGQRLQHFVRVSVYGGEKVVYGSAVILAVRAEQKPSTG